MSEEICDKIYSYLEAKKIREDRIHLDTVKPKRNKETFTKKNF